MHLIPVLLIHSCSLEFPSENFSLITIMCRMVVYGLDKTVINHLVNTHNDSLFEKKVLYVYEFVWEMKKTLAWSLMCERHTYMAMTSLTKTYFISFPLVNYIVLMRLSVYTSVYCHVGSCCVVTCYIIFFRTVFVRL